MISALELRRIIAEWRTRLQRIQAIISPPEWTEPEWKQFGRALVGRLRGETRRPLPRFMVPADFAITKRPGRREYPRACLVDGPAGRRVVLFPSDSSGVLVSMTAADGLVELSEAGCQVAVGDLVPFLPFTELLR